MVSLTKASPLYFQTRPCDLIASILRISSQSGITGFLNLAFSTPIKKTNLFSYVDLSKPCAVSAAAALTANGLDKATYDNKLVFLMTIEKARFRNPVIPDCVLELNIEAIRSHGRVWKYKGTAFVGDKKMADAQWSATIVDRK